MIKYQIFEVGNCIGKWYFCRQKYWWGWGTPNDSELRNNYGSLTPNHFGEYINCKRFGDKEWLISTIREIHEKRKLHKKVNESIYYKFVEEIAV